jgi:hypothetical protein
MTRELGWEKNAVSEGSREFVFDVTTLGGLVETMVKRLNAHSMRVVGDAKMPVKRVVTNWGYARSRIGSSLVRSGREVRCEHNIFYRNRDLFFDERHRAPLWFHASPSAELDVNKQ